MKICLFCLVDAPSNPRLNRLANYFVNLGHTIIVAGLKKKKKPDPRWTFIEISDQKGYTEQGSFNIFQAYKKLKHRFFRLLSFIPHFADSVYFDVPLHKDILAQIIISIPQVSLVIAYNHQAAPLAFKIVQKYGCRFWIEVEEHALSEYKEKGFVKFLKWFFWNRPYVHGLQKKYLPKADCLISPGDEWAKLLHHDYNLSSKPTVIRSTPLYESHPFRPVDPNKIKILYHGIIHPQRNLETTIRAMVYTNNTYHLTIRGLGNSNYIHTLKSLITALKLDHRVNIEPPVFLEDMMTHANQSDIGIFVWDSYSVQRKYVLPNKFFEYIMAGLALCISDLPEMTAILHQYDLGVLVNKACSKAIACMLNDLTVPQIESYKKRSLEAAKDLCFEKELRKLNSLC